MSAITHEATLVVKPLASLSAERPLEASAEFRVGLRSAPYLADHGFQDMVVLPGSFYVDMALRVERELFHRIPVLVRNMTFHQAIVLAAEDTVIKVAVRDAGRGHVTYTFYEAGEGMAGGDSRQFAAKLEVAGTPSAPLNAAPDAFDITAFQARAETALDSDQFYRALRANGNQYGDHFQNISAIWRAGDQTLGQISVPRSLRQKSPPHLHPRLLDAMTQLLAPFATEKGKTMVLRSIERMEISDILFPGTLWGRATRRSRNGSLALRSQGKEQELVVGDILITDEAGQRVLELSGVTFALLDRVAKAEAEPESTLAIAANFTAEPLEDSLNFWADHFGLSVRTEFAPYNQIFQQLLGDKTALRKDSAGVNVILLSLEEWASRPAPAALAGNDVRTETPSLPALDKERAERCFGDRPRCILPNGLEIVHLNRYETDYVYREIFEDQCYLRGGIRLRDEDTVVDIGANIGLFSLFVLSRCRNPRIYAFEPAPVVYELLQANCRAHGPANIQAVNAGVSDKAGTATFTFYEKSSVFSGFHANEDEDRQAIQAIVRNVLEDKSCEGESLASCVDELTADRLQARTSRCPTVSVSDLIREHGLEKIDLLKIDAEKSELDILLGIAERDWPKISQIVIEIHDRTNRTVGRVTKLLDEKGYHCTVEREKLLEQSGLVNLFATRHDAANRRDDGAGVGARNGAVADNRARFPDCLKAHLEDFCTALHTFMSRTQAPLILCVSPRTPMAQADAELGVALDSAERALMAEAGLIPHLHTIGSNAMRRRYPVEDYYDPHGHHLGHIPYTPQCYTAMGTAIFRAIFNLKRRPCKVIVLDCDNTLWKGVCGEDGPRGIELSPPHRSLQDFMVHQMNEGMLLCLCSKNHERDVLDVLDQRPDMPLKREHLISWRINWNPKSENIKSLAQELDLALDSFIFIDDNPVDCADVNLNCPGVLTLQLPRNPASIPLFLDHIWAFDHGGSTAEDRNRTRLYRDNVMRRRLLEHALSLKDYVQGLQLRVEMAEATEEQYARISQLTFRTNQFNFTSIRRSESEIQDVLRRQGAHCLVVRVADRFGDYGLVGAVLYEARADRYQVDTLLLSCRVLGRGVEHEVVAQLGRRALREGKQLVELTIRSTERNQPAREFIASIASRACEHGGNSWTFPAQELACVQYDPEPTKAREEGEASIGHPEAAASRRAWDFDESDLGERLQRIGGEWHDPQRLGKAIEEYRLRSQTSEAPFEAATEAVLQTALLNIWRRVLGRPRIGPHDNFFEVGGTSLRAVQIIAAVKKELKRTLSIVSLFEYPTVALLTANMGGPSDGHPPQAKTAGAALRGRNRRYKTVRRPNT